MTRLRRSAVALKPKPKTSKIATPQRGKRLRIPPSPNGHEGQFLASLDDRAAAKYLGVARITLQLWRKQSKGPKWFRAGPKLVRYRMSDLNSYIDQQVGKPASQPAQ